MAIRRIIKDDCNITFITGNTKFDTCPYCKTKLALRFYYERDHSGKYETYVLEEVNCVIGFICFQKLKDYFYLNRIGVKTEKQRLGYGAKLLKHMMQKVIKSGKIKIMCETTMEWFSWFKSKGFEEINRYCDPHWGKCFKMELNIIP